MYSLFIRTQAVEYRWDGGTNTIKKFKLQQTPDSKINNLFSFFEYNGHKAMSLNMDSVSGDLMIYLVGVHEGFHYKAQDDWIETKGVATKLESRGLLYPLKFEPRYFLGECCLIILLWPQ